MSYMIYRGIDQSYLNGLEESSPGTHGVYTSLQGGHVAGLLQAS